MKKTSSKSQPKGSGVSTKGANHSVAQNHASAQKNITKQSIKR